MTTPQVISQKEWEEILITVREPWDLPPEETVATFSERTYGVKYRFVSGGPGYTGDLYVLLGDTLSPPLMINRDKNGTLEIVDLEGV